MVNNSPFVYSTAVGTHTDKRGKKVALILPKCSNALPFNLVHFPKGDYPGKLTQREIISEEELSEHLDCLSE